MASLDQADGFFTDDLMDLSTVFCDEDGDDEKNGTLNPNQIDQAIYDVLNHPDDPNLLLPDFEEELEWISNKDAFPSVDTFVDMLSCDLSPFPKQLSPISVLENSSNSSGTVTSNGSNSSSGCSIMMSCCRNLNVPVKARGKRNRRRDFVPGPNWCWWVNQGNVKNQNPNPNPNPNAKTHLTIGRKCQHCGAEKTPQWRAGPLGPKTLCNACGVRFKSGRLVPEYRPANSPTFSSEVHSNSHRKIVEMRRQKVSGFLPVKPNG